MAKSAEKEETQLAAALALLDRGYGRPTQAVEAPEREIQNVVRVPLPAQSAEEWQREADLWRAQQAAFGQTGRPLIAKPN